MKDRFIKNTYSLVAVVQRILFYKILPINIHLNSFYLGKFNSTYSFQH